MATNGMAWYGMRIPFIDYYRSERKNTQKSVIGISISRSLARSIVLGKGKKKVNHQMTAPSPHS